MKKIILAVAVSLTLTFTNCTKDPVEPNTTEKETKDLNFADKITGTYSLSDYIYNQNPSVEGNAISVTRLDDTHITIGIDYLGSNDEVDLEIPNVLVEESEGNYSLSREFSNANMAGTVIGNTITIEMVYDDGDEVTIIGEKQ